MLKIDWLKMFEHMIRMHRAILSVLVVVLSAVVVSCSDDDCEEPNVVNPSSKEQWSATLKGNGEELGAYPDLYSNYWEYTYENDENVALCFSGEYPYCRYFSFSIYNDETGDAIGGIDDSRVEPDGGYVNPFVETATGKNRFTLYVVSENADERFVESLNSNNVCRVKGGIKRVAVALRQYLGTDESGLTADEYGGVELPAISAIDVRTRKAVAVPEHVFSNVYLASSNVYDQKSDENKEVPFFLAPVSRYYPNNSTSYLYARTHLKADEVLVFSFIPAPVPEKVEDYATAVTRYWSICLGSAKDTRSYQSLCDNNAYWERGKKATFVICLKNNTDRLKVEEKVASEREQGEFVNLIIWDSEKVNIEGNPIGEYIALMYRNILPDLSWQYSISTMLPTAYKDETGEPIDHVTNPERQLAHKALGDYGPLGIKILTSEYLK